MLALIANFDILGEMRTKINGLGVLLFQRTDV